MLNLFSKAYLSSSKWINNLSIDNIIDCLSKIGIKNKLINKETDQDRKFIITADGNIVLNTKNKEVINEFEKNIKKLKDKE